MSSGKTSHRRRQARRERKKRARGQEPSDTSTAVGLVEQFERLSDYVTSATSFEEAAELARRDTRQALHDVVLHARGQNLLRVVQSVRVGMVMDHVVRGVEQAAAVLELTAIALVCRDETVGLVATPERDPAFFPPRVQAAAREALEAGAMISMFENPPHDPVGQVLFASVQREIRVRNPIYPQMLVETLRGLFSDPEVNRDCQAVIGCTGLEVVSVMEATRSLLVDGLTRRFARMEAARDASIPFLAEWENDRASAGTNEATYRAIATELMAALEDLTTTIDEAAVIDTPVVAERAECSPETVETVIEMFTLRDPGDVTEVAERFFHGDNPLRTAPIVGDLTGRRMLVHDALALPAVREVLETRLNEAGKSAAYLRHRGQWVEDTALDLLAGVFPGATIHRSFEYFVPDPQSATPQTDPASFTKRVEADGLIVVDDVALIVEVKAVALSPGARAGVGRKLQEKLRDIVTKAAVQAERLRERILTDRQLRLNDGEWLDVSGIREVHTIAVSLEDLSGVSTATALLVQAGVLSPGGIPWTVSLHDLRIICDLVDRPAELLLYLRRRTHPEATQKYLAVDELDLYLHFLELGLYVEPDPHGTAEALPWSGQPSVADLRRYAAQHRELIESRTDPLDAWYAARFDPEAPPAPKPVWVGDPALLQLVDDLAAMRRAGWLSTAAVMMEGNAHAQRRFGRQARDLSRMVKEDGQQHSCTRITIDTAGNPVVIAWACCGRGETLGEVREQLEGYLSAKKHQVQAHRAALMIFDTAGTTLLELLFDNREPGSDPDLDEAAQRLFALDKAKHIPPSKATRRKKSSARRRK